MECKIRLECKIYVKQYLISFSIKVGCIPTFSLFRDCIVLCCASDLKGILKVKRQAAEVGVTANLPTCKLQKKKKPLKRPVLTRLPLDHQTFFLHGHVRTLGARHTHPDLISVWNILFFSQSSEQDRRPVKKGGEWNCGPGYNWVPQPHRPALVTNAPFR